jgi:hypothetical protein
LGVGGVLGGEKRDGGRTGNAENWRDLVKPLPFERAATAEEIGGKISLKVHAPAGMPDMIVRGKCGYYAP